MSQIPELLEFSVSGWPLNFCGIYFLSSGTQVSYQRTLLTRSSQRNAINVMKQHAVLCEGKTSKVPGELMMTELRADTPLR